MQVDEPVAEIGRLERAGREVDPCPDWRFWGPCGSPPAHCRPSPGPHEHRRVRHSNSCDVCASRGTSRSGSHGRALEAAGRDATKAGKQHHPARQRPPDWRLSRGCQFSSISAACAVRKDAAPDRGAHRRGRSAGSHCAAYRKAMRTVLRLCRGSRRPGNDPTPSAGPSRHAESAPPPAPAGTACATAARCG